MKCKGDALRQFFASSLPKDYDAFCFFDADNLVDPGFLNAMNAALCEGVNAGQGLREARNSADSHTASLSAIYFWVLARFIFKARTAAGLVISIKKQLSSKAASVIFLILCCISEIMKDMANIIPNPYGPGFILDPYDIPLIPCSPAVILMFPVVFTQN